MKFFLLVLWEFKLFLVLRSSYFLVLFVIFFSASLCFSHLITPYIVSGVPRTGLVVFLDLLPEFWSVVLHLVLPCTSLYLHVTACRAIVVLRVSSFSMGTVQGPPGRPRAFSCSRSLFSWICSPCYSFSSVLLGLFSQFEKHQCIPCSYLFFSFFELV